MDISEILERKWVIPAAVGVAGTAAGFIGGYFVGRRNGFGKALEVMERIEQVVDETIEVVVEETTEYVEEVAEGLSLVRDPDPEIDGVVIEEEEIEAAYREATLADEEPEELTHIRPDPEDDDVPYQRVNVFPAAPVVEGWDEEFEASQREVDEPYIIHRDVFMNNETEYRQETLTYYEGDDIMADEQDTPIYNYTGLTGPLHWGHGSGDAKVVYVRNDKIHMEWEILKHSGRFEFEVQGHTIEESYESNDLKHSKVSKFRDD